MRRVSWLLVVLAGCQVGAPGAGKQSNAVCGNGTEETGEECDLGVAGNFDGGLCTSSCKWQFCGDGLVGIDEECDAGGAANDDCRANCTLTPPCGNGRPDPGEHCDDGNDLDTDACTNACTFATCGDGILRLDVVDPGAVEFEACDDGVRNSDFAANACRLSCRMPLCGDAVPDKDEDCDNGLANSDSEPDACRVGCLAPSCGDGVIDNGEECDDGAGNSDALPNTCRTDCRTARCGDIVVDDGEVCDEGEDSATCDADCTPPSCGDGYTNVVTEETCDDVGESPTCDVDCSARACGDGLVNVTAGEECDTDSVIVNGSCTLGCEVVCATNFGDCTAAPGCETNLQTEELHCGSCGHDCQGGECGLGVCQPFQLAAVADMMVGESLGLKYLEGFVFLPTVAGLARVSAAATGLTALTTYALRPWYAAYTFVDDELWFFSRAGGVTSELNRVDAWDLGATPVQGADGIPLPFALTSFGGTIYGISSWFPPPGTVANLELFSVPTASPDDWTSSQIPYAATPALGLVANAEAVFFSATTAVGGEVWRTTTDMSDLQMALVGQAPMGGFFIATSGEHLFWAVQGGVRRVVLDPYACLPAPICPSDPYVTVSGTAVPAIASDATHLYWTDPVAHAIRRKSHATGDEQDLLFDPARTPGMMVAGPTALYWLEVTPDPTESWHGSATLWKLAK